MIPSASHPYPSCRRSTTVLLLTLTALSSPSLVACLSSTPSVFLFDRFTPICPADEETVRIFDPSLVVHNTDNNNCADGTTWVAVYRSSNNKPSVFVRDEFLNAMRSATDAVNLISTDQGDSEQFNGAFVKKKDTTTSNTGASAASSSPVAVARLYQPENASYYLLDSIRCVLKKEDTDTTCDGSASGASEHTEALCVAIDALLERYLQSNRHFEGAIRTKATLVAAPLLETRGFAPVQELTSDMATHVSSLDQCLASYAERAVASSKSPAARQRAINIVSRLGRIDRVADLQERSRREQNEGANDDDYDPWKSMRQYF